MLTAADHFKSIYNPRYFSSDLPSSLITTSLLLYSAYISIFHETSEVSWQAEEEDFWNELLASVRGGEGGEGWINGGNGGPQGREGQE